MAGKAKRLSKVARELNVGINTIVDFLSTKGYEIDSKPNTKIEDEVYEILLDEYQDDQTVKEKSKKSTVKKTPRQTITLEDAKDSDEEISEDEDEEDEIKLVLDEDDNVTVETVSAEEKESKKEQAEAKKEEKNSESEKEEEVEKDASGKPKVVGKIDLDSINQKTKPDRKSSKKEEEKPAEKAPEKTSEKADEKSEKEEAPKKEEKAPEKTEKKEEAKEDAGKEDSEKQTDETIKTKYEKLSGPTVVGKIDLPAERKRSDKKKTDDDNADKKRKRKRIKKVNVDKSKQKDQKPARKPAGRGRHEKAEISEEEIQKEIKETLARLSGGGKSKASKHRRAKRDAVSEKLQQEQEQQEQDKSTIKLTEFVTVSELASMLDVQPTEIISACMSLGIFVSINQRIDAETIQIITEEFGFTAEFVSADIQDSIQEEEDKEEDLEDRSPIVTVMGHVDHGKTSLLDYIRKANVIGGEAGGITQHIGAYSVKLDEGKRITFLDTPGHEAFTAMRARGAQVTDIAIIIIAADDNVMPQTKEAINHAQAAGVPMVFAINKIDSPNANPDRVKEELASMNILVEEWGGKYQSQDISAKKGTNIDALLEKVLLEAEILELKANPNKNAVGTIIESSLDKGRGYVTTLLVQAGTLKVGDMILAGQNYGRVKAMHNERGKKVKEAGPSIPVSVLGLNGAPSAGDKFNILDDEREAKSIANRREQLQREQGIRTQKHITLDEISRRMAIGDFKELNIIVKGDVDGSIEALSDSLIKLSTEEIQVNVIHKAVGQITESDVLLASASDAIIIGFQVRPSASARKLAENEEIDIRMYSVIYKAIEELKDAMEGMLSPDTEEKILGTAEIRETFKISKVGTIAGCYVTDGKINRNSNVRIIRDGIVVYTGALGSLKRFKDDVKEVSSGYECGLNIDKFNDIKEGDIIEAYEEVEVARKLK